MPISSFTDLTAWQEAHKFVLMVYEVTKQFPKEEAFGLTQQLRRAAVSITSNIAEGFSRQSKKEKAQFYHTSLGSLTEIQNQLFIAKDVYYLTQEKFGELHLQSVRVSKLINGLIKSVLARPPNT
ncbi:MAG TPA: four helix bundle protein [Candidatus Peribacteraceae bacterium]|nr:four helix bundle protein [Candidatus Peribacteraceae bacterium]